MTLNIAAAAGLTTENSGDNPSGIAIILLNFISLLLFFAH